MILPLQTPDAAEIAQMQDSLRRATAGFVEGLKTDPEGTLHTLGQSAIEFGLKVVAALAIYAVGAWIIRRIKKVMRRRFDRKGTDKAVASFSISLVSITLTILLIVITISTLGINTTSLAALLAAGGVAIGMALSGTAQNFAGGIMLLVFKPFKAGDYIVAQGQAGTVEEVNIVSTKIRTVDNRVVVLPNGSLSNGTIDNYSGKPLRRIEIKVGVEYGTPFDKCRTLLMDLARKDSRVLDSSVPGAADPFVELGAMNDSNIEFYVRVWVQAADYWDVFFALNKEIYNTLPANGVNFAFPHMDITLKQN